MMSKVFEPVWKNASKKWKCPLHNMCSYLAMFPPALPNYFIEQFTNIGDLVLDPFSGRGTALLEAARCGRIPIGNDLNPLAYILSYSKVHLPKYSDIINRVDYLERNYIPVDISSEPEDIKMLYDLELTLPQLCYLKDSLNKADEIDVFILGALMGIMHGSHKKDGTSCNLSISMPNTFSMSPNYVREYIEEKGLIKIRQDVFSCLKAKIYSIYPFDENLTDGMMFNDNALNLSHPQYQEYFGRIKLIITSPPYLKVINYGKYNWIRLWMLDENSKQVDESLKMEAAYQHSNDIKLTDDLKLDQYLEFMKDVICGWERLLTDDGVAAIVIGDVDDHKGKYIKLAEKVWEYVKLYTSLHFVTIIKDDIDGNSKVTKIWGQERKGEATKVDRILVLTKSETKVKANRRRNILKYFTEKYGVNK